MSCRSIWSKKKKTFFKMAVSQHFRNISFVFLLKVIYVQVVSSWFSNCSNDFDCLFIVLSEHFCLPCHIFWTSLSIIYRQLLCPCRVSLFCLVSDCSHVLDISFWKEKREKRPRSHLADQVNNFSRKLFWQMCTEVRIVGPSGNFFHGKS